MTAFLPLPSMQVNLADSELLQMQRRSILAPMFALLAGCATIPPPVPDGYAGPTAVLSDSGLPDSRSRATLFSALALDGQPLADSLTATRKASFNQGFAITVRLSSRKIKAVPAKVRIIGTHQTGAPIHELAARAAGTFFSVEGTVDFKPVEGRYYTVTGKLSKEQSCVWIVDDEKFEQVTEKVCSP